MYTLNQSYDEVQKKKNIVDRLEQSSRYLSGRNRKIADAIIRVVSQAHYHMDTEAMAALCHTLWEDRASTLKNAFTGLVQQVLRRRSPKSNSSQPSLSQAHPPQTEQNTTMKEVFAGDEYAVLVALFGEALAQKVKSVWDRSVHYIYDTGYLRRSWRSKDERQYLESAVTKLIALLFLVEEGFSPERYFDNSIEFDHYILQNFYFQVVPDLWAFEIDNGNQVVKDTLRETLFAETTLDNRVRPAIKALLMSNDPEAHQWVSQLLLAAKLQEGLRQAITELIDHGSRTSFVYMLKLILEHDLLRFSSVVRAFDTWTGLGIEAQKPLVIKKCLTTAYRCLTDAPYIEECLESNDAILLYIGLWAIASDDVTAAKQPVQKLLSSPQKYKRTTALYFLGETHFPFLQHHLATPLLDDPELEVKSWALRNLFGGPSVRLSGKYTREFGTQSDLEQLFEKLAGILDDLPKKEVRFDKSVFPWGFISISQNYLIWMMMVSSASNVSDAKFDVLLRLRDKMDVDTRQTFVASFVKVASSYQQRLAVLEFLDDKSPRVRSSATKLAAEIRFESENYRKMEDMMRLKSGDLRKNVMKLLLNQTPDALLQSIQRLASAKDENKQLAALDLIISAEKNKAFQGITNQCRDIALAVAETSQKTRVLAEKIVNLEQPQYSSANGFGLYNPKQPIIFNLPEGFAEGTANRDFPAENKLVKLLHGFDKLVHIQRDYEYEVEMWDGQRAKRTIGGSPYFVPTVQTNRNREALENYPLPDVWRQAKGELEADTTHLLMTLFFIEYQPYPEGIYPWFQKLTKKLFPYSQKRCQEVVDNLTYPRHVETILQGLVLECPQAETFSLLCKIAVYLIQSIPPERFREEYRDNRGLYYIGGSKPYLFTANEFAFWFRHMKHFVYDDASFEAYFSTAYIVYQYSGYKTRTSLDLQDFERAFQNGLIDENELYAELMGRDSSPDNMRILSTPDTVHWKKDYASCHKLEECNEIVIDRVLSIELKRGDMPTEVSRLAGKIHRCSGAKYFVNLLIAGEKETYTRGYYFASAGSTKQEMFSSILKNCYPDAGEDAGTLRQLLQGRKVSEKQLIDAAMYAPQWLDIVEAYLRWHGLAMAGWYFHAHVSETFSNEKKTIVARYSPVDADDFGYGAFDINWFQEAYNTLGDKRFKTVYNSAKYIGGGALHRRSQLFADATLGRISVTEAEEKIGDKRNKDYVLCLGLIPLANGKEDMLQRYEFLQEFLRQSKQFGAQRRESEARAVSFALQNLARNAGYTDVNRFTWSMETEKIAAIERFFRPTRVGEVDMSISINKLGESSLLIEKGGKTLKGIPASLKKHETVLELKGVLKSLKDQHSRARKSLEAAMVTESGFTMNELTELMRHPVICPLLRELVFKNEERFGWFRDGKLVDTTGRQLEVHSNSVCVIAHPVHLYEAGVWSEFQRDVVARKVMQPFKQVFRESYRPNADELSVRTVSQRYAGHQIQPQKTVALLRGRGWTVNYEEGLQRVYHAENVIGHIYALADWFSPAEVEAPTIEEVHFTHRKTGELLPLEAIPPLIFSEVMRDVDLAVSVAHVGGVDPEASHSTVEMRTVLIGEMLRLLKLTNVVIKGTHAHIEGKLGEYTVHLGSGVVHKMATGAVHILPVHSQHRGRIFLPFVDDDPRTAEIISKITLLAEDTKIKDPNILEQLRG